MNELRFVLVPKRLTDQQFWGIYFAVTRSRLPAEAFDSALQRRLAAAQPSPEAPQVRRQPEAATVPSSHCLAGAAKL